MSDILCTNSNVRLIIIFDIEVVFNFLMHFRCNCIAVCGPQGSLHLYSALFHLYNALYCGLALYCDLALYCGETKV